MTHQETPSITLFDKHSGIDFKGTYLASSFLWRFIAAGACACGASAAALDIEAEERDEGIIFMRALIDEALDVQSRTGHRPGCKSRIASRRAKKESA